MLRNLDKFYGFCVCVSPCSTFYIKPEQNQEMELPLILLLACFPRMDNVDICYFALGSCRIIYSSIHYLLSCVYYASCDPISCQLLYRGRCQNTENNIFEKLQQVYGNNFPKKSCCASIGDEIFWSLCSNLCSRVKPHVAPIYCRKYG